MHIVMQVFTSRQSRFTRQHCKPRNHASMQRQLMSSDASIMHRRAIAMSLQVQEPRNHLSNQIGTRAGQCSIGFLEWRVKRWSNTKTPHIGAWHIVPGLESDEACSTMFVPPCEFGVANDTSGEQHGLRVQDAKDVLLVLRPCPAAADRLKLGNATAEASQNYCAGAAGRRHHAHAVIAGQARDSVCVAPATINARVYLLTELCITFLQHRACKIHELCVHDRWKRYNLQSAQCDHERTQQDCGNSARLLLALRHIQCTAAHP